MFVWSQNEFHREKSSIAAVVREDPRIHLKDNEMPVPTTEILRGIADDFYRKHPIRIV